VRELGRRGIAPRDVTVVFNTHAHVDHSHNNVLFPAAKIVCSARDRAWTRAVHDVLAREDTPGAEHIMRFYPEVAGGGYNAKLVRKILAVEKMLWDPTRLGDDAQAVWLEDTPTLPGVRVVETPGHSPHHVSYVIETGRAPVLVCGDALLLKGEEDYGAPMMPQWSTAAYAESRARLCQFRGVVVPGHDEPYEHR